MRSSNWSLWVACGLFLLVLAILGVVVRTARGDDFDAKIAQLKAKMAAKKADPFAGKNKASGFTTPYMKGECGEICGCGCIQTGACTCPNCNSPVSTKPVPMPIAAGHNYSWAPFIDNPDLTYLWDGETCIGYYCYSEGGYHKRTYNGYEQATSQPPVPVPQRSAAEVTSHPIPYYQPTQQYYYQPVRSFGGFRSFGGAGCSTGG